MNPIIAERLTAERSRDYMNGRRVAKEYEAITRGLNKVAPSVPPTGNSFYLPKVTPTDNYLPLTAQVGYLLNQKDVNKSGRPLHGSDESRKRRVSFQLLTR